MGRMSFPVGGKNDFEGAGHAEKKERRREKRSPAAQQGRAKRAFQGGIHDPHRGGRKSTVCCMYSFDVCVAGIRAHTSIRCAKTRQGGELRAFTLLPRKKPISRKKGKGEIGAGDVGVKLSQMRAIKGELYRKGNGKRAYNGN